jgi:hypothetical protein
MKTLYFTVIGMVLAAFGLGYLAHQYKDAIVEKASAGCLDVVQGYRSIKEKIANAGSKLVHTERAPS